MFVTFPRPGSSPERYAAHSGHDSAAHLGRDVGPLACADYDSWLDAHCSTLVVWSRAKFTSRMSVLHLTHKF